MPEPTRNLPFAYRLPTDVAAQIHGTAALDSSARDACSPGRGVDALGDVTRGQEPALLIALSFPVTKRPLDPSD